MTKKVLFICVGVLVLAALAAGAYYYLVVQRAPASATQQPDANAAKPDDTVAAGPIVAVTPTSITIRKQNNTTVSFDITADTKIILAGEGGQPGVAKNSSDLAAGTVVLVEPSRTNPTQAQTVLIIPPPAQ